MNQPRPGARVGDQGVTYCVWAPDKDRVAAVIEAEGGKIREIVLRKDEAGYHQGADPAGKAGDAYGYRIMGEEQIFPDPASRGQRDGVHGRSLVVDGRNFGWNDEGWRRPRFRDLVIYEVHIGTFTAEGTFRAAAAKLPYLKELGVTAIEIMPIADFPGDRNWGYDGVLIYAPARCYGTPDDLRHLVNEAHRTGVAVVLDVVYNHLGPDGNYLSTYSPFYFNRQHKTPWGDGFNFDGRHHAAVRQFFRENPAYWMEEYHIDGFRFDATHEIKDDAATHILAEMTDAIHARGGYAMAEDERNEVRMILPTGEGGIGFDGVWADDFHHTARVGVTAERSSYFSDFTGTLDELVTTLRDGWFYRGQLSGFRQRSRGTDASVAAPERFVHCISNHDQVGNRALGERLNHLISPAGYRALSMLLCLSPYTPLLFMGQEWGASTPFLFFTDHNEDLGRKITEGRRREFAAFPEFAEARKREQIPDPQQRETYERSRLDWTEAENGTAALYRACLRLRGEHAALRPAGRNSWHVEALDWGAGALSFSGEEAKYLLIFDLFGGHQGKSPAGDWRVMLGSEEERFGGEGTGWRDGEITFRGPAALLLAEA